MRIRLQVLAVIILASAFSSAGAAARIGICKRAVSIYHTRSFYSRTYCHVTAGTRLVVSSAAGKWYGVVMEDGRLGWTPTSAMKLTSRTVNVPQKTAPLASRGRMPEVPGGNMVTSLAQQYLGIPYVWGGNTPTQGLDCSGYVKHVFGRLGVNLPRRATYQMGVGEVIARYEDLRPGDRLYFSDAKHTRITHTGIYLGNGYFIHANASAKRVSTSYLFTKKWMNLCVAARR